MKQQKRIISSLMALVLALTLVFVPNTASAKTLTAKQILTKTTLAMQKVKNYEGTSTVALNMKADGQPLKMTAKANTVAFLAPTAKTKTTMKLDTGLLGTLDIKSYSVQKDNTTTSYFLLGDTWYKQSVTADPSEVEESMSTEDMLFVASLAEDAMKSFKVTSTKEKIGKQKVYSLKGSISGKMIKSILEQAKVAELLQSQDPNADLSSLEAIANANGKITVKYWIDQKTMLPVKVTIDMGNYLNSIIKNVEDAGNSSISKYTLTMSFKNFNKAKKFTIPAEAKNGQDISELSSQLEK